MTLVALSAPERVLKECKASNDKTEDFGGNNEKVKSLDDEYALLMGHQRPIQSLGG